MILGRPWSATVNAYISCRTRDMTISNGVTTQKLVLYPPAQPSLVLKNPLWVGFDEDDTLSVKRLMKPYHWEGFAIQG